MRCLGICQGLAVAALLTGLSSSARAEICASYADGTSDCYFKTLAQCQAGIRSRGGSCIQRGSTAKPPDTSSRSKPAKSKPATRQ